MKLNLLFTLTKKKTQLFFLLIFLQVNKAKTGQAFKNCLNARVGYLSSYESLLSFLANNDEINNGHLMYFCCKNGCSSSSPSGENCLVDNQFFCIKISQTIFCENGLCGGILGDDALITTNTTVTNRVDLTPSEICPDISEVANSMPNITPTGINIGFARIVCSDCPKVRNLTTILYYDWDNGGWTYFGANEELSDKFAFCFGQWVAPSPILSSLSPSNSPLSSIPAEFLPWETATIATGTTIGVISVGGITYYFIRKKKKNSEKNGNELKKLQEETKIKSLEEQIQIKKAERDKLFTILKEKSSSKDTEIWLKNLLSTQKKDPNSPYLKEIKKLLESNEVNIDQVDLLCEIQKEVQELKKQIKKVEIVEIVEPELINQIEVIPSTSNG